MLTLPIETLQKVWSPNISSTIWEITSVTKMFLKTKSPPSQQCYGHCWSTITPAISECKQLFAVNFCSSSLPQMQSNCTALLLLLPCYRVGKGSGGLSGGWWEAVIFIPGTKTAKGGKKGKKKEKGRIFSICGDSSRYIHIHVETKWINLF